MQDLKIGQPVTVKATIDVGYHKEDGYHDNRRSCHRRECKLKQAVVTGRRIKQLGIIHGWDGFGDYDGDPSYLKVTGVVELWEIRTGMLNKPLLVADDDLCPGSDFELPRMSRI